MTHFLNDASQRYGLAEAVYVTFRDNRTTGYRKEKRKLTKLTVAAGGVASLSFSVVGVVSPFAASGASPVAAQQAGPTITITDFMNEPADLTAEVGQAITVTNNDGFPHTVTADDGTFNVDVPAKAPSP